VDENRYGGGQEAARLHVVNFILFVTVRELLPSGIAVRVHRHSTDEVCSCTGELPKDGAEPASSARALLERLDLRFTASWVLTFSPRAYSGAVKRSAMRRSLERVTAVLLGNAGLREDLPSLTTALADDARLARGNR